MLSRPTVSKESAAPFPRRISAFTRCNQLAQIERLRQIIVSSRIQKCHYVAPLIAGRQHQNRSSIPNSSAPAAQW